MQDPNLTKLKQTRASNKQQTSEQTPGGPIAAAGPQLCKVESNNNKQHPTNQRASINQSTNNSGDEQYCSNSLQTRLYPKIGGKCNVKCFLNKHFRLRGLSGKYLRSRGPSKGLPLCKHLRKLQFERFAFCICDWNCTSFIPHSRVRFTTMVSSLFVVCFF